GRDDDVAAPHLREDGCRPLTRGDVVRDLDPNAHRPHSPAFGYHRGAMADPKIEFLRNVPLFAELDDHTLREITNAAVEQKWASGQEIVRQGDTRVGMC